MAYSFTSSGATPNLLGALTSKLPSATPSTPVANALNKAQSQAPNMSTVNGPKYASPVIPAVTSPSTAVKQQTVTHPDGTTIQQTYHAPDTTPSGAPNQTVAAGSDTPGYTYQNGILTSVGGQAAGNTPGLLNSSAGHAQTDLGGNINPGNTGGTTPSGAVVDANGNLISGPTNTVPSNTYSGLINASANSAQNNKAIGQSAADIAASYGKKISDIGQQAAIAEQSVGGQGMLPVALGRAQQIAQTANSAQTALATGEQAALQGTGQQLTAQNNTTTGLLGAGNLAAPSNKFLQVPYSNQVLDENGNPVGGGTAGTLPAAAQTFVNSLASQVQNGQMTRDEATSQLTAYGPAGLQALNTALGSNFNTNASNSSAATTATGQQIAAAIPPANQALDALQTAFNGLNSIQQGNVPLVGNVPIIGQIAQNISMSTNAGGSRDAASAYQGALNEARARIDGALAGVIGVDAASKQASALLPDNMVPSEIPQKIAAAKQYLQNQLKSYTTSGAQNNTNQNGNSNSTITWDNIVQ